MNNNCALKKTSIGGQALIEGLMMIGPKMRAIAVRRPSGEITLETEDNPKPLWAEKIPFLRGSVRLFRQMGIGMRALFRSADLAELVESNQVADWKTDDSSENMELKRDPKHKEDFFEKHPELFMSLTVITSFVFGILLFALLPNLITELIRRTFSMTTPIKGFWKVGLSLIEGLIRICIFLLYLAVTKRNKEIERVWCYHGAEHKTISCYEAGEGLTVENVRLHSRLHPRCGTSFLFLVMLVSVLVFSLTGWHNPLLNLGIRILLLPVIAGISFELIRWTGRSESKFAKWLSKPGLALQNLTTAEPDDKMLEVAITAMEAVIPGDDSDLNG